MDPEIIRSAFRSEHGSSPRMFYAPGRVNLIGEHTDYNDGFVLPLAIERGTWVAGDVRSDRTIRVRSLNIGESVSIDLDRPGAMRRGQWSDYVEGVVRALIERGHTVAGAALVLQGDVPSGAGLSSSASIEVAVALALTSLSGAPPPDVEAANELALVGQRAEHTYVGTQCGIMDQLIAARGEANHALLVDCRSLDARLVPLASPDVVVLICDSKVKHSLATSAYNDRRAECERAVKLLAEVLPGITALRNVSMEDFARYESRLLDPVRRRARHVVTENARVQRTAAALERGALDEVGKEMFASHDSMRDDFQISCEEIDCLVDLLRGVPGVFGSRMTGGGFGGCTVSLVAKTALPAVEARLRQGYEARYRRLPDLFVTRAAQGAHELG